MTCMCDQAATANDDSDSEGAFAVERAIVTLDGNQADSRSLKAILKLVPNVFRLEVRADSVVHCRHGTPIDLSRIRDLKIDAVFECQDREGLGHLLADQCWSRLVCLTLHRLDQLTENVGLSQVLGQGQLRSLKIQPRQHDDNDDDGEQINLDQFRAFGKLRMVDLSRTASPLTLEGALLNRTSLQAISFRGNIGDLEGPLPPLELWSSPLASVTLFLEDWDIFLAQFRGVANGKAQIMRTKGIDFNVFQYNA